MSSGWLLPKKKTRAGKQGEIGTVVTTGGNVK
jgi:hypothetical protein